MFNPVRSVSALHMKIVQFQFEANNYATMTYTYLSIIVNGICCRPIDFQFWFAILGDLTHKRYSRSDVFTFSAIHVIHFEESYTIHLANESKRKIQIRKKKKKNIFVNSEA